MQSSPSPTSHLLVVASNMLKATQYTLQEEECKGFSFVIFLPGAQFFLVHIFFRQSFATKLLPRFRIASQDTLIGLWQQRMLSGIESVALFGIAGVVMEYYSRKGYISKFPG